MGNRASLVKAYMEALEARALLILAGPTGQPSKISTEKAPPLDVFDAIWFSKPAHLELVMMRARGDLDAIGAVRSHGWIDMPAREVRDLILNAAAQLGAQWRTTAQIEAGASAAVEEIIASVEAMRQNGGLAEVNARYKIYRQRQVALGQKAIPYSAHLHAFTWSLVTLAAKSAT